jgi:tetratricopeptide (TPR) repeat protein
MRRMWLPISMLLLVVAAAPALASFGGSKPDPPPSQPAMPSTSSGGEQSSARMQAEQGYALAYEEVAKAKKDLAGGKAKNAEKKFKKALERGEDVVKLAPDYHEAWNLVGYCSRKLGNYDRAFEAYEKCVALKWDYAPAREYMGEAWLEKGDPKKAREQLVLLERIGVPADAERKELAAAIATYETAHPGTASASADSSSAPSDSATAGGR